MLTGRPRRVVLVSFGTLGDILPFCVLGQELSRRGCAVRFVTISDYHDRVRRSGLEPVETGAGFDAMVRESEFEALFGNYFASPLTTTRRLLALRRRIEARAFEIALVALDEIARADLVVYNPFAYFAGAFARECGCPAVRVIAQPLLPSGRDSLSLFGGRRFGRIGNRLSYEAFRAFSPVAARIFGKVARARGVGRVGYFANPLTVALRDVHHLIAYSPALSPDPGDWPVPVVQTGAWHASPDPEARLPEHFEAFLAAGPPPVYVGFGSMIWGAKRNTEVVMKALAGYPGRAIVNAGSGGLHLPDWSGLLPKIQPTTHVDHALLFPRCAAIVHHGGAGTTAAALRAGKPSVVLPLLGDQLYWGRRVAAVGAGQAPIPLGQIAPEQITQRIVRACSDPAMTAAAAAMARRMEAEPGVAAAADLIASLLARKAAAA